MGRNPTLKPTKMTQTEIEIATLKARMDSLENQIKFLNHNWVEWTKDTKITGQKLMAALSELTMEKIHEQVQE